MTDTEAAWLAGIVDGEGYFTLVRNRPTANKISYWPEINVSSTAKVLVDRCKQIAGGFIIGPIKPSTASPFCKLSYRWVIKNRSAASVAATIMPFLVLKFEQAQYMIKVAEVNRRGAKKGRFGREAMSDAESTYKRNFYNAVRALNHRGTSPIPEEYLESLRIVRSQSTKAQE